MAKFQVVLSEDEVQNILINTVRKKFNLDHRTPITIIWNDDSGATFQTPDESIDGSDWLSTDDTRHQL